MSFKAGVLGFVAAAVIGGCGGDAAQGEDGQDGESVALLQVPAGDKNCPTGGVRVTVDAEASYVCNGQTGATGATGAAGTNGTNGTNGTGAGGSSSFTPVGLLNCTATPTLSNGAPLSLTYNIVTFSDGSAFVTCSVNSTGLVQGSSTAWFAPWQV